MKTIEKEYPYFTVGKRYYLDGMKDASYELIRFDQQRLYFGKKEGESVLPALMYIENPEGLVVMSAFAGIFYEIIEE